MIPPFISLFFLIKAKGGIKRRDRKGTLVLFIIKKLIMSCWSDASPNFKKNFKDWLGDIAYREFLRHVSYDCSLDVINDWWRWSKQTTIQDVNYIYQELFRMVREYDPVTWSDDPLPSSAPSKPSFLVPCTTKCIVENTFALSSPDCSQPDYMIGQNDYCESSQHGIADPVRLFLHSCDSTDDARDFHFQSMQSCDSIDFSDDKSVDPTLSPTGSLSHVCLLQITPSQNKYKSVRRIRPSPEFRSSFVRPFRRK
jgi:hypothetical protein